MPHFGRIRPKIGQLSPTASGQPWSTMSRFGRAAAPRSTWGHVWRNSGHHMPKLAATCATISTNLGRALSESWADLGELRPHVGRDRQRLFTHLAIQRPLGQFGPEFDHRWPPVSKFSQFLLISVVFDKTSGRIVEAESRRETSLIPEHCHTLVRPTPRNVALVDPGELHRCPKVLRQLSNSGLGGDVWPTWSNSGRCGCQILGKIADFRPKSANLGRYERFLGQVWPASDQFLWMPRARHTISANIGGQLSGTQLFGDLRVIELSLAEPSLANTYPNLVDLRPSVSKRTCISQLWRTLAGLCRILGRILRGAACGRPLYTSCAATPGSRQGRAEKPWRCL